MPETDTATTTTAASAAPAKGRSYSPQTISALFMKADLAVTGTENNPEIQAALIAAYNYTADDVQALKSLTASTKALFLDTTQSRAMQLKSTGTVKESFKIARKACADFALMCREELKGNTAALAALGLTSGPAPLALAPFLTYADTLFGNAREASHDMRVLFARRGYTEERLTQEQSKIADLRAANAAQETAKARAQNLTPQQQAALDQLTHEVNKLRKYARRALTEQPQLLEAIGLKV